MRIKELTVTKINNIKVNIHLKLKLQEMGPNLYESWYQKLLEILRKKGYYPITSLTIQENPPFRTKQETRRTLKDQGFLPPDA